MAETTTSAHRHPGAGPVAEEHLPGFARRRPFALVLLVTGVIGWVASAILVLERLQLYKDPGHVTSCDINPWVSCGRVMGTWQSELFGFPNPLIGIVAFAVVITTAMALLSGARFGRWYWVGLQTGVTLGAVFVIWLWSQALFSIYILCLYCMIVWCAQTLLLAHTTARMRRAGLIGSSRGTAAGSAAWAWLLGIGVLVIVFGIIAVRFSTAIFA